MATKFIDFERSKLYEQVWAQALGQGAESYGLTAAEVKRVAQTLEVPLPPSGHWTKVEHGKGIARPPLPDYTGDTTHELIQWVDEEAEEVSRRFKASAAHLERQAKPLPEMRTAVADCLPIIKKMAARLKKGYKDARQWPAVGGMGHFDVSVSPQNQERALLTIGPSHTPLPSCWLQDGLGREQARPFGLHHQRYRVHAAHLRVWSSRGARTDAQGEG